MAKHILIVDDDALLRRSLAFNLEQSGFRVSTAATGEDALSLSRTDRPDLVLLDIGLPGMDGTEILQRFKTDFSVPVIFLTARRRELDEILGLELGADDYISKPFNADVVAAHIKSVLRRAQPAKSLGEEQRSITVGDITIDPGTHSVFVVGESVELTPREFALLHVLALEEGRVVPVDDLLARVWGAEFTGEPQVVYVHIRWLREKIEEDPNHPRRVLTVRGVGYRLAGKAGNG